MIRLHKNLTTYKLQKYLSTSFIQCYTIYFCSCLSLLKVDAIFDYEKSSAVLSDDTETASDPIISCFKGAAALMMRKDNRLDTWWNPALASLMADSVRWKAICNDISDEHGKD